MTELFRRQVVEKSRSRLYGEVRLDAPPSGWAVLIFLVILMAGSAVALSLGSYARKETATGWLVPDRGLAEVVPGSGGVVEEVHVELGDAVEAGAPLVTVKIDTNLTGGAGSAETLLASLADERREVEAEIALTKERFAAERTQLAQKRANLVQEREQILAQLAHQEDRVVILAETLDRYEGLLVDDAISPVEVARHTETLLAARQAEAQLRQLQIGLEGEIRTVEADLARSPIEEEVALAQARRQVATLEQRQTEYRRAGRIVLTAPMAGRVASLSARGGQAVTAGTPLAAVLPEGGVLEAELFIPTKAAGFVEVGQPAKVRLDAFPSQKFGMIDGLVASVSSTVSSAADLPLELSDPSPVYRCTVRLTEQSVSAYGRDFHLQPGMTLSADLVQGERRLWEVVLDPLRARG